MPDRRHPPPRPPLGRVEESALWTFARSLADRPIPFQWEGDNDKVLLGVTIIELRRALCEELYELPVDVFTEYVTHGFFRAFECLCEQCRPPRKYPVKP